MGALCSTAQCGDKAAVPRALVRGNFQPYLMRNTQRGGRTGDEMTSLMLPESEINLDALACNCQ